MLDYHKLKKKAKYNELPETLVIFITKHDVLKDEKQIYHVERVVRETNKPFGDGTHIMFDEMMNFFRAGDELIVTEISRLVRSTVDLLNIVEILTKKNLKVRSLREDLDSSTPQGKFMLTIFGAVAEFER